MSESQKRRAKRLVEILTDAGFLIEGNIGKLLKVKTLRREAKKETWINFLTDALTKLETEEIKAMMKKARK